MTRTQAEEQNLEDARRLVKLSPVQEATDDSFLDDSSTIDPQEPLVQPTPNDPPWNSLVAIGVWILSVVFIGLVPLIFVTPYALSKGYNSRDAAGLHEFMTTDPTAVILQLAPIILAHALTLVVAWFVVTKFKTYSFRETLGWSMNGFRIWHGFLITVLFYGIALSLTMALGDVESEFDVLINTSRYAVYLVALFATFTAPLVEEVVYRGLLFSAFQRRVGIALATVFVTILFTAVHVPQYSLGATPDFAAIITLLLLSLTLTLIRARTGNLLPCIVLHTIFNASQSILLVIQTFLPSTDQPVNQTVGLFLK